MRHNCVEPEQRKMLMLASVASMIDQFNMSNIRLLQDMGYEVHVACNFIEGNTCDEKRLREFPKLLRQLHVVQHQWDCPRKIYPVGRCIRAYWQLLRLTDKYEYNWIHCHSPIGGVLARLAAHRKKIRIIYTAHGFHFYKGAPFWNWMIYYPVEKLLSYWTDVLITVNREDYVFAKRHLRAGKTCYTQGVGINTKKYQRIWDTEKFCLDGKNTKIIRQVLEKKNEDFLKKYRIPKNAIILLSVGELSRRKNHKAVISVLARLVRWNAYYIICGQGVLKEKLIRQAEALGVADYLKLPGYQENITEFYQNADVFVFPSIQEGLPVALMEAMAAGLPCIVSDIRGNRELVDGTVYWKQGGIRFPLERPIQMLAALELFLKDQELRKKCGCYNQNKIIEFDRSVVEKRMKRIYTQMEPEIKISVLIAVYHPNVIWLEQLLVSVCEQTLPAYEIILMDDGSVHTSFQNIQTTVFKSIGRKKQIFLYQSRENEGFNKTFEKLVHLAKGNYIAFCDQDDIWEKDKLLKLAEAIKKENAVLAYSDMSVINENNVQIYSSLQKMRIWFKYVYGDHLTAKYLADNCIAGCSMLVKADLVKKIVPFCKDIYYDQWIAACASAYGRIAFVNQPLVRYRRHGTNQTGFLSGIENKQDYYEKRVLPMYRLVKELRNRNIHFRKEDQAEAFAAARKDRNILRIWKNRKFNKKYAYFDLVMICLPDRFIKAALKYMKHRNKQKQR